MLPLYPSPANVCLTLMAMQTSLFTPPADEREADIRATWDDVMSSTWHLPRAWRRHNYVWADNGIRWFALRFVDEFDWGSQEPTLDVHVLEQRAPDTADVIHRSRF